MHSENRFRFSFFLSYTFVHYLYIYSLSLAGHTLHFPMANITGVTRRRRSRLTSRYKNQRNSATYSLLLYCRHGSLNFLHLPLYSRVFVVHTYTLWRRCYLHSREIITTMCYRSHSHAVGYRQRAIIHCAYDFSPAHPGGHTTARVSFALDRRSLPTADTHTFAPRSPLSF